MKEFAEDVITSSKEFQKSVLKGYTTGINTWLTFYSLLILSQGAPYTKGNAHFGGKVEGIVFLFILLGGQPTFACQYDPCKMSSSFEAMGIETGISA